MTLHLELLLRICDILAEEHDSESLKNCALVCSPLAALCQRHLFACVTLLVKIYSRRANRLWKVLRANPKIGTHIKELRISFARAHRGIYANPTIPCILAYCTSVTSFKLETLTGDEVGFAGSWPQSLPQVTLEALESIIYSPTLTRLEIDGFSLPSLSIFLSPCSSSLNELHFLEGSFEKKRPGVNVQGAKGSPIFLRKLSMPGIPLSSLLEAEREDGSHVVNFSRLQDVSAHFNLERDVKAINTLLFRCAAPLTSLRVEFTLYGSLVSKEWTEDLFVWCGSRNRSPAGFPCFSTLRFIEVNMWCLGTSFGHHEVLFHRMHINLRHFPEQNVLENIVFNISMATYPGEVVVPDDWLTLATSFITGFPCLKGFDVNVVVHPFRDPDGWPAVVEVLKELPFKDLDLPFNFNFTVTANAPA